MKFKTKLVVPVVLSLLACQAFADSKSDVNFKGLGSGKFQCTISEINTGIFESGPFKVNIDTDHVQIPGFNTGSADVTSKGHVSIPITPNSTGFTSETSINSFNKTCFYVQRADQSDGAVHVSLINGSSTGKINCNDNCTEDSNPYKITEPAG